MCGHCDESPLHRLLVFILTYQHTIIDYHQISSPDIA